MDQKPSEREALEYEEKNRQLFESQVKLLKQFLERGAISQTQYDKSLHDLIEKTGYRLSE
ncbi:MAG: hypothetical protein J5589_07125 [Firmicutes bacterium]|nr:hypothetical protein [Bacillota bacterium]